jgi:hypothetical protein
MAFVSAAYTVNQAGAELVPAVAGKIVQVQRIQMHSQNAGSFKLLSDPGGGSQADLFPLLNVAAGGATLNLSPGFELSAERGKALGISTSFSGTHQILVWYRLLD